MSRTEEALQALIAALAAQANGPGGIPVPLRNETLPTRFVQQLAGVAAFFNVMDGDGRLTDTALGNPDEVANVYHVEHRAEVEWAVQGGANADREAAFDAGLVAVNAALAADRTLGGVVDWAEIVETKRSNLVTEALPNTKAIVIFVALTFISSAPF